MLEKYILKFNLSAYSLDTEEDGNQDSIPIEHLRCSLLPPINMDGFVHAFYRAYSVSI